MRSWVSKLLVGGLTALSSGSSHAIVSIDWTTVSAPIFAEDGTSSAVGFFAQLIWTDDLTTNPLNTSDPFNPTGGERVINTATVQDSLGVGIINEGLTDYNDDTLAGGYVYTRVFNSDTTPTFFGDTPTGPTGGTGVNGSLISRTALQTDPSFFNSHDPGAIVVSNVIPEPSVLLLFALGGGGVLAFRRRK